ncbi:MAG: alpha/beta fold hydrolase [Pseudomonadales bacterium]|nr:alpha/beta fold hydrolase [Pseudomonadales bacterium]
MPTKLKISISDQEIEDLRLRLKLTRWPEAETPDDWSQGIPLAYTKEIVDYWLNKYDMQRLSKRLGAYNNFITEIDGLDIHYMHVRSTNPNARPLLLTHGWPGSVVEFLKVIGPLTEPQQHGGDAKDAYHLVIPSLPGFGWSGKPTSPGWGIPKIAVAWAKLMAELGYDRYFAQGGDWGAIVTSAIGATDTEHCAGIHVNMIVVPPDPTADDLTDLEKSGIEGFQYYQDWDSGYSKQQSTRPQTLGYGLVDSPAGQAAWIIEKFWAWMDCDGKPENILSKDELLDNVMVYWLNAAGASSARIYWESFGSAMANQQIGVPMGGTIFPKEIFRTSRRFAAKVYTNIVHWEEKETGGHFAAFEQPEVYTTEVRNCFRQISL